MTSTTSGQTGQDLLDKILRWGGLVVHVGIGVFPLSASGLLAPGWALATIAVAWALTLVAAWRIGLTRPRLTPLVPLALLVAWFGFITAGDLWLGWTA